MGVLKGLYGIMWGSWYGILIKWLQGFSQVSMKESFATALNRQLICKTGSRGLAKVAGSQVCVAV